MHIVSKLVCSNLNVSNISSLSDTFALNQTHNFCSVSITRHNIDSVIYLSQGEVLNKEYDLVSANMRHPHLSDSEVVSNSVRGEYQNREAGGNTTIFPAIEDCQWPNPGSQSAYRTTGSSSSKTNAHVCCYVNKWRKAAFYKDFIYKYTAV